MPEKGVQVVQTVKAKIKNIKTDNITIPYKEIFIPIDAVKGFIIGPTADFDYIYSSLEIFLASKGLSELDQFIVKSEVPYRG